MHKLTREEALQVKELRVCKKCGVEKDLATGYSFHLTTGYFHKTCKECLNDERRDVYKSRIESSGGELDTTKLKEKKKKCTLCKEEKPLNKDNFYRSGSWYKMCKDCCDKANEKRRNIYIIEKDKDYKKICNICKEEKYKSEFSYSRKYKFYSYCCRECDSKRTKERKEKWSSEKIEKFRASQKENYKKRKHLALINNYKKIDERKGQECNLTPEFVLNALNSKCVYCGDAPSGLDRKDNSIGHTEENCVPCCLECNTSKMDIFTYEEMFLIGEVIKKIKEARKLKQ